MKRFLQKIGWGFLKVAVAFTLLAGAARFVPQLNWFFFQRNLHTSVYYTTLSLEDALAQGRSYDVLVVGSSVCEFSLDPQIFQDSTGLTVFKYVTGGQTIDLSARLAQFLAPRLHCKYVILDAYPRFGPGFTEEGVERIILNTPQATSGLALTTLKSDPYSPNTDFLWAARAIGTAIKPYDASDRDMDPKYESMAPGYAKPRYDGIAVADTFTPWKLNPEAVGHVNDLHVALQTTGQQFVAVLPPVQNGAIVVEGQPNFEMLRPEMRPDTCFWDQVHLRQACVPRYSAEVARLFNGYRKRLGDI